MLDDFKFEDDDHGPDPMDDNYDPFAGTDTVGSVVRDERSASTPGSVARAPSTDNVDLYAEIVTEDGEVVQVEDNTPIPASLPIVYEGLSAQFKPGSTTQERASALSVTVEVQEAMPIFNGDLFLQFHKEDRVSYEDMATQFNLKPGTVKNYSSWANRVPPAHRIKGMTVTIFQEAASIRDPEGQREFIEKAVNGDYSKRELRAMKEGDDPEDGVGGDQEVEKATCPTCGTKVRAELLG